MNALERAEKLVTLYMRVTRSDGFARVVNADPIFVYTPEEIEFLWELIDRAFDEGQTSKAEEKNVPD